MINPDTIVKKYLVIPVKNRFIPDIIKNGRIVEPGIYWLNRREVHRASQYGYVLEEVEPDIPSDIDEDELFKVGDNKIGVQKILI